MTANLAAALVAFQQEMPTVAKTKRADVPTKSGGKFSYTYADLADVTEAAMPLLTKHGLSFITAPRLTERGYELRGVLMHTSGESIDGALPINGGTPQEMGSALTYARRYLLGCLTGVVTDNDDDGALASKQQRLSSARQTRQSKPAPAADDADKLRKRMFALFHERGIEDAETQRAGISRVIGRGIESRGDLTPEELRAVISALEGSAQ